MAKKGGFFSSSLRPRLTSSSSLFARRGDPLVTSKEQLRDFGRNPETEVPERDWWFLYTGEGRQTRARMATPRVTHREAEGKPTPIDDLRRATNIRRKMRNEINRISPKVPRPSKDILLSPDDEKRDEMNVSLSAVHRKKPVYGSTGLLFKKGGNKKQKRRRKK